MAFLSPLVTNRPQNLRSEDTYIIMVPVSSLPPPALFSLSFYRAELLNQSTLVRHVIEGRGYNLLATGNPLHFMDHLVVKVLPTGIKGPTLFLPNLHSGMLEAAAVKQQWRGDQGLRRWMDPSFPSRSS